MAMQVKKTTTTQLSLKKALVQDNAIICDGDTVDLMNQINTYFDGKMIEISITDKSTETLDENSNEE